MFKFHCSTILLAALLLVAPRAIAAVTNVITFNELPLQPVNGVSLLGVTFGFQIGGINSIDARFGDTGGPGITPLNMPPHLEGNTLGLLTLNFATPINFLEFGSHLATAGGASNALSVQFYDAALLPLGGPVNLDMTAVGAFAGGVFHYDGLPASRAVIDFNEAVAPRFVIDNLAFAPVPEPALGWLIVPTALAGLALRRRLHSRR